MRLRLAALPMLMLMLALISPVAAFHPAVSNEGSRGTAAPWVARAGGRVVQNPAPDLLEAVGEAAGLVSGIRSLFCQPDGRLAGLQGRLSEARRGDPVVAAQTFLQEHPRLIGLPTSDGPFQPKVVSCTSGGGGTHVRFVLTCGELAILDSGVSLHFDGEGCLRLVNGAFPQVASVAAGDFLPRNEAIAKAATVIGLRKLRTAAETTPFLRVEDGSARPAWQVSLPASDPLGDWVVLIDGLSGEALRIENALHLATGRGSVHLRHPLYGKPVEVSLPFLARHDLCGEYAQVNNMKGDEAFNEHDIHCYAPENTHFAEVMAYHHTTRMHDFFVDLGCTTMNRSMMVHVHHWMKDNAFYSSKDKSISLGDGSLRNDYWAEESVIYHEYAHAVLDSICHLINGWESGAMNEGQADYFAATIDGDPVIGEYVMAREGKPWLRNLTDWLHYPEDIKNDVHEDGRIWGATLWDLRSAVGAPISDRLLLASFHFLKTDQPTFTDGFHALLAADDALNGGANQATIRTVFARRGIPDGTLTGAVVDGRDLVRAVGFSRLHERGAARSGR